MWDNPPSLNQLIMHLEISMVCKEMIRCMVIHDGTLGWPPIENILSKALSDYGGHVQLKPPNLFLRYYLGILI